TEHLHDRIPTWQRVACRRRCSAHERQHDHAGHGHAQRRGGKQNECAWAVSGDGGIRHGRRVADGHRMGRPGGPWVGELRRDRAMTKQLWTVIAFGVLTWTVSVRAQSRPATLGEALAAQYVNGETGLSLDEAISRALDQEPTLRAARTEIDVAKGVQLQARLRPNPTVSFMQQNEAAGTHNQS